MSRKVDAGRWVGIGTGFIVHGEGTTAYAVANDHVVHPSLPPLPPGQPRPAPTVTVVFGSGTRHERSFPAEVAASDPENDLAVVRVAGVKDPPAAIDLKEAPEPVETTPVFIFGFAFGQALALHKGRPVITVGKGTVAGVRLDDRDKPVAAQIDGSLDPGNSGGPVVDGRGRLVGVAVAPFHGPGVGLAIVPARVTRMLEGGVTSARLVARRVERGTAEVEAQVVFLDPLHRVRAAALHYVRLDRPPDRPAPAAQRGGAELPGSRRVDLKVEGHRATATFPVETNCRTELHLSFQVSTVNAAGATTYQEPAGVTLDLRPLTAAPSPAGAGVVLAGRWLLHAGRGAAWPPADARWSVGRLAVFWGGVGLVVGLALGRTAWHRTRLARKVGVGVLVGALAGAVSLALCSPLYPFGPGWRRPAGPGAVVAVAAWCAGMGAVAGAMQGAVAAVVFDGARRSLWQGVERAVIVALVYVIWSLVWG